MEFEILGTAVTSIGNRSPRIAMHALFKAFEGGAIEGLLIGLAHEVFRGDHKALAVEGRLQGGTEFGLRVTLALLDGPSIEIIKGDETVWNVALAVEFESGLFIED